MPVIADMPEHTTWLTLKVVDVLVRNGVTCPGDTNGIIKPAGCCCSCGHAKDASNAYPAFKG